MSYTISAFSIFCFSLVLIYTRSRAVYDDDKFNCSIGGYETIVFLVSLLLFKAPSILE